MLDDQLILLMAFNFLEDILNRSQKSVIDNRNWVNDLMVFKLRTVACLTVEVFFTIFLICFLLLDNRNHEQGLYFRTIRSVIYLNVFLIL